MDAEAGNHRKPLLRKPSRLLWITTLLVITYGVWCGLLCALTASGLLVKRQAAECGKSNEVSISLEKEAILVYVCSSLSLPVCILLLVKIWIRTSKVLLMLLIATTILFVTMVTSFAKTWDKEAQEIQEFKEYYLALIPLAGRRPDSIIINCRSLRNVHRWQAEFKCCGLESYRDWGSRFPKSCLCEGKENSSGCVAVGSSLVYEKPCLPTVLSLIEKRNTPFWTIMILWIILIGVPVALLMFVPLLGIWLCIDAFICDPCCSLNDWNYKMSGGEEMVQVVFLRKANNNERTEEEHRKDGEAKGSGGDEGAVTVKGEGGEEAWDDTPVSVIPLSLLRRLQEELDPPPVEHLLRCTCLGSDKPGKFYTVLIEEGSPLLPGGAVLADASKSPFRCLWTGDRHMSEVQHVLWPTAREPRGSPPPS